MASPASSLKMMYGEVWVLRDSSNNKYQELRTPLLLCVSFCMLVASLTTSIQQMSQMDTYDYPRYVEYSGQLQPGFHEPFPPLLQDANRNGLPRIDTKALAPRLSISDSSTTSAGSMMPQTPYSWADGHLHVHAPLGTPLSPSNTQYPTFSPSVCLDEPITLTIDNRCVRSRKAYLLFPHQCHPIHPLPWVALTRGLFCRLSTTMRFVAIDPIDVHVVKR